MNAPNIVERDGLVALIHHNSNPSRPIQVGEKVYQSSPQHNISLMWVLVEDAERIINSPENRTKVCNCGGGVSQPLFRYANDLDVSLFETGDRPH
jgi:hypothetical protein